MKVIIDAFGGDYAPEQIVLGAILALKKYDDLKICLTGDKQKIVEILLKNYFSSERLEIIDAKEVITNDDKPTEAIRKKTNSSLVVAFEQLKQDDAIGMISAGSTGAVLTGAFMKVGRIDGISRPALAPMLPTLSGKRVLLLDVGANMDCKAINLLHFAIMGNECAKANGVENPKIALLNVGTENGKGNELTKEAFELLSNAKLNFVGNCEARDILSGDYDVIVADGFAGNVALKSSEGVAKFLMSVMKKEFTSSFKSKMGALLLKKNLKNIKKISDYRQYGGANFLGTKKLVIKSHGDSKADTILKCVEQIMSLNKSELCKKIEMAVASETTV